MKTIASIVAATIVLAAAGAAAAADPHLQVQGFAPAVCTLPTTWAVVSSGGGAGSGQFSGTTWTIPQSALSSPTGTAISGSNYAIRVRGMGFCNTSHTIQIQSSRGGLVTGSPGTPAPDGFAKRRPVRYEAYWSDGGVGINTAPVGPNVSITASSPNQQASASYLSGIFGGPPGHRHFDIALRLLRPALETPLVAGEYSDTVTVTITLGG